MTDVGKSQKQVCKQVYKVVDSYINIMPLHKEFLILSYFTEADICK